MLDFRGDLQWNAGEKKLTGGANWQPKVAPATWSTGVPSSAPLVRSPWRPGPCGQFASSQCVQHSAFCLILLLTMYFSMHSEVVQASCNIYQNANFIDFILDKDYDLFFNFNYF